MSDSIWKKEITLRRKPKPAPERAPAADAETSIWKKELTFRRKEKPVALEVQPDPERLPPLSEPSPDAEHPAFAVEAPQPEPERLPPLAEPSPHPEHPAFAVEAPQPEPERLPPLAEPSPEPEHPEPPAAPWPVVAESREREPEPWLTPAAIPPEPEPERAPELEHSERRPLRKRGHAVTRTVGLKIGASQVAAARVANNGAAELLQVARVPLEPGIVVAGELRDPDALAATLKQFFARNKLPRKNVRLGIASNRIGVRIFELAGIEDEKQLANAVRFRAQEVLPIPPDEAVLDYRILSERVDEEGNTSRRVLLVVAYRELVERYVSACKKAGISLSGIDLEAFALLRALSAPLPEDREAGAALVAVAIGHDRSTFAVSDGRICEFTRVLDWGGSTLNVALARALDLAPSAVDSIKRELSLDSAEPPRDMDPRLHALALDAVRRQVLAFARELVSSLQFYQHQPGALSIGELVITGGTASLGGLAGELERLTGVRVRIGDPLARLKVAKRVQADEQFGSLAIAIGLGIED